MYTERGYTDSPLTIAVVIESIIAHLMVTIAVVIEPIIAHLKVTIAVAHNNF